MALQGSLTIKGGNTYNIVECFYGFHQSIDDTGKPISRTQGGTITFVTPSMSDKDVFFYKWMFNKTKVQSGSFKFTVYSDNNNQFFKTIEFENAYCIALKDYFNDNDSKLMYTTITISAQKITIGSDAEFSNEWD